MQGENRKDEAFMALSPHGTIPTLQDGDWAVSETAGIVRYIRDNYDVPESLLPREDKKKAAEADMWLAWNQNTLRPGVLSPFRLFVAHFAGGVIPPEDRLKESMALFEKTMSDLNSYLGRRDGAFVFGENYTLVDIAFWSELSFHPFLGVSLDRWENIKRLFEAVEQIPEVAAICAEF